MIAELEQKDFGVATGGRYCCGLCCIGFTAFIIVALRALYYSSPAYEAYIECETWKERGWKNRAEYKYYIVKNIIG